MEEVQKETQLLARLQRIPADNYDKIIRLVQANKSVFDKPGLRPNAIDCVDRAVNKAIRERGDAYWTISRTYNMFVAVLGAVERRDGYWDTRSRGEVKQQPKYNARNIITYKTIKPNEGIEQSQTILTTKGLVEVLRQIFDMYVKAKLMQYGMSQYTEKLRISTTV